jgi:radical SAM protein with 4Fe4S-binding SPASM domain
VIDQADGKCEAITLASRGEPLINREIEEMLAYCQDKFLGLKMNTNAWYMDEKKCHAILQSGMNTLVFSADAATEPLYSQLRVGGKLDRVVDNVRQFRDIRAKHYPNSKLITRVSGVKVQEEQDIGEMDGLWGELVDQVAFVKYNPWENTYVQEDNDITEPCSDLWRRMFVWHDGTINPCDVDYKSMLAIGDANKQSLSDLWQSEKYDQIRSEHLKKSRCNVFPCSRCTVI